jgi:hypothetical protein
MEPATASKSNAIQMGLLSAGLSPRGLWKAHYLRAVARLPQDAALYRKNKVIDEVLQAVAPICLEICRGRTKRRMRPLFNGIQIRRNRLKGVSQSPQIGTHFCIHGRHRWK